MLRQQIALLLTTAPAAAATANATAAQIGTAVTAFHNATRRNTSEEGEVFLAVAAAFATLGTALEAADGQAETIAALEATVAAQKAEIERLTALLSNMPRPRTQIMVAALGGAGATALTGTAAYLFGPDGTAIIENLWQYFTAPGPLPPPPPMSIEV